MGSMPALIGECFILPAITVTSKVSSPDLLSAWEHAKTVMAKIPADLFLVSAIGCLAVIIWIFIALVAASKELFKSWSNLYYMHYVAALQRSGLVFEAIEQDLPLHVDLPFWNRVYEQVRALVKRIPPSKTTFAGRIETYATYYKYYLKQHGLRTEPPHWSLAVLRFHFPVSAGLAVLVVHFLGKTMVMATVKGFTYLIVSSLLFGIVYAHVNSKRQVSESMFWCAMVDILLGGVEAGPGSQSRHEAGNRRTL